MGFEWDEEKNRLNVEKHGVSFEEAVNVFNDVHLSRPDTREEYGEVRVITIGMIAGTIVAVVGSYGPRRGDQDYFSPESQQTRKE